MFLYVREFVSFWLSSIFLFFSFQCEQTTDDGVENLKSEIDIEKKGENELYLIP